MKVLIRILMIHFFLVFTLPNVNSQNPNWTPPAGQNFQFTANVIAQINLSDTVSNSANDVIALFKDEIIVGLSNAVNTGNGNYRHFISLYSNYAQDTLSLKVYHQGTDQVYEVPQPFIFQTQSLTGTVDDPFIINIYPNNDAPIWILPIPAQYTIEGLPFNSINLNDYLVQPDGFPVDWTYYDNPNLEISLQNGMLSISAIPGFTGPTLVTVRATETPPFDRLMEEYSRVNQDNMQYDETVISFDITPLYDAPLWQPVIPGQGIILGEVFDDVPLHHYENQFDGPYIMYDYIPVIEESNPIELIPNWQLNQTFGSTMALITQLNYTPKYQFNHADDVLAAFIGNEVRGIGQRNEINGLYYLSVGGEVSEGQKLTFKFYSGSMKKVLTLDSVTVFQPYKILGNDASPFIVDFAPIIPIVLDGLTPDGVYNMPIQIVDGSFTGNMTFTFIAMDPEYPDYLRDETNATFCIVPDSSYLTIYYQDADGDGLGNPLTSVSVCFPPDGYVTNGDDCNDDGVENNISIAILENSGTLNDGLICPGTNTTLTVLQSAQSYHWSSGHTTQSIQINPTETSIYTITVTFATGCVFIASDTILVEGLIVKNSANSGFNSLRNIVECAAEESIINYNLPLINGTTLTEELIINKNLTIQGTVSLRPEIGIDYFTAVNGITIATNKKLTLENIDIKCINANNHNTFTGTGAVDIIGITHIGAP